MSKFISKMLGLTLFVVNIYTCNSDSVYAAEGSTVELICPFTGGRYDWFKTIFNPKALWYPLSDSSKYNGTYKSQISIYNVDVADDGNYLCRSSIGNTIETLVMTLYVTVNGQWSIWGSWTLCTVTCGGGTQNRNRYCNNPTPVNGGSDCQGINYEFVSCNSGACPVNGQWSIWGSWTPCTVTCGGGTQNRNRYCNSPPPVNGGSDCQGANYESILCNSGACPVNSEWSTWGNRTTCNVTCGGGTRTRYRYCNNTALADGVSYCQELNYEIVFCNREPCAELQESSSIIGPVAGGVLGCVLVVALVAVLFFVCNKRKSTPCTQNHDYETRDMTKVELHLYDATKGPNITDGKLNVHENTLEEIISNENHKSTTFTMYNVPDFMRIIQDKSLLAKQIRKEYQVLKNKPVFRADGDYEIVDIKSGAAFKEYTHKDLIKKQDDGKGYIVIRVPDEKGIDNFWTMITKYHVAFIVLLSNETEKISEFFPHTIVPVITHTYKVEICSLEKCCNNIFEFVLDILNKEDKTVVQVKLYKITDWKDGEIHPSIDTMCKMLHVISNRELGIVAFVGSNDGFSLCGDLGACHEVLYAIENEKEFNIVQIVVGLKDIEPELFQTFEQYNLVYEVIGHFLQNEHTYAVIEERK